MRTFHIHGDNIVECERAVALIRAGLDSEIVHELGPIGSPVCPTYEFALENDTIRCTAFPGFGRWNQDILAVLRHQGGRLREAADILVTRVEDGQEILLLAIEFCGALPAGNQAWQRSGRAWSHGKAMVPYMYVAELAGFELDSNRDRKAARMPNPAVPFSYLAFSLRNKTSTLPVFVTSPGADSTSRQAFADIFAEPELVNRLRSILLQLDDEHSVRALRAKALSLVAQSANSARSGTTLTGDQWQAAHDEVASGRSLVAFLVRFAPIAWSKTAYIQDITASAVRLMEIASNLGIGLTSSALPMCIIPATRRSEFAEHVVHLYDGRLRADFQTWLKRDASLCISWVMGFKPRGDDARPDRGLPPLTRMLVGDDEDMMTVVYGPAPRGTWASLETEPALVAASNGLWESILGLSDAILIDSPTDLDIRRHGYVRAHWERDGSAESANFGVVEPRPLRIGENDIDTVLHLLFARHAGTQVFEGLCNPPGGDWSGISLQSPDRSREHRWLSLPRVSGPDSKRPDHVIQLFLSEGPPIVVAIESKERAAAIEVNIGNRLTKYVRDLCSTTPSVERTNGDHNWCHSNEAVDLTEFRFASIAACLHDSAPNLQRAQDRVNADLVLSFNFGLGGTTCAITCHAQSLLGVEIASFLARIPLIDAEIVVLTNTGQ